MLSKKFLLCLILGIMCFSITKAQKYYGQWVIGIHGSVYQGIGGGIEVEKYLGKSLSFLRMRISYSREENTLKSWKVPTTTMLVNLAYFYSLEKFMPGSFLVNLGGGLQLGQERYKSDLPVGVVQAYTSKTIAGIIFHPQAEISLGKGISMFTEPSLGYLFSPSAFSRFHVRVAVGIKYYFSI